jgi:hypothetical protein
MSLPDREKTNKPWTVDDVVKGLQRLLRPGQVTELRAPKISTPSYRRPHTVAGFFDYDHAEEMAAAAMELTEHAVGVYFTFNPLKPEILARRPNTVDVAEEGDLAGDQHVLCRRFMYVDVDPIRITGIGSTDEEKEEARKVMRSIRHYLRDEGWPEPIQADSGNGWHSFYPVDLPVNDKDAIKKCLQVLASKFGTDKAKVDQTVFNPARIAKVPGTWARKGGDVPDRPHRQGRLL